MNSALELMFAFYCGGIIASVGYLLGGIAQDPNKHTATVLDYLYGFCGCFLWPAFIIQVMYYKRENENGI